MIQHIHISESNSFLDLIKQNIKVISNLTLAKDLLPSDSSLSISAFEED